jgi:16S rRNA (adenine1518-N6/adenine1519-N6)-dimethyltransferase
MLKTVTQRNPHIAGRPRPPRAKKSLGQNFLVDRGVLNRLLAAAELSSSDVVVEVGPGRGVLTRALAERAGRVLAVELDEALARRLTESLADRPNVTVISADAREMEIDSLVTGGAPYKLVANLPYYAASPIVRRFLEARHKPTTMVVMLQREVAQEMVAEPGKMGLLSVATQLYGRPRIVSYVPPRAFSPAPKVTSAIVRIDVYAGPVVQFDSSERFFTLVRAGFSARRKQLHNSLRRGLDLSPEVTGDILAEGGIDPTRRAQTLSLPEWGRLHEAFRRRAGADGGHPAAGPGR